MRQQPRRTVTRAALPSFDWAAAALEAGEEGGGGTGARPPAPAATSVPAATTAPVATSAPAARSAWGNATGAPASVDSWFGGKVDTGPVAQRKPAATPKNRAAGVQVLDRPVLPDSLEFAADLPESFELHFQEDLPAAEPGDAALQQGSTAPQQTSGEEFGPAGYWHRWTESSGQDESGAVQWYERWWEVSDWKGMKELGAEKWGCNANGDAWRETWKETISVDPVTGQPSVARSAHKWANNAAGDEWEEKWDEGYLSKGAASKSASKWARQGAEVWHEEWGEDYDGAGGCVKYTNKWAEAEEAEGGRREWGDKWEERFKDGKGAKTGETWSVSAAGDRFNRWWGEDHYGDGSVRKHGHSTAGEAWDAVEQMDTYYNPIPHFGYELALAHSPQLRSVPTLPWEDEDDLGDSGLGAF